METECNKDVIIYRIDKNDIIKNVSDNWSDFAVRNRGGERCAPGNVVGGALWDFIDGSEARHLYGIVLGRIRERDRPATFPFRCDSPKQRRFLELNVCPMENDEIEFRSSLIRTESREPVKLLNSDIERSNEFIHICSMCKKIALSDKQWEEVEEGIVALRLFEKEPLPQLTHSFCPSCYNDVMAELDKS